MLKNNNGFTLVELSIVIVIVGLLIGGILVGQSLIESAKVNRLVNDIGQWEIATVQFKQKFKYYPGDSGSFTPPGNQDNELRYGDNGGANPCAAAPNASLSNYERYQFWAHLSQAKMLSVAYPPISPDASGGWFSCSGTHTESAFFSGKYTPYTEAGEAWWQATIGSGGNNYFVDVYRETANFAFLIPLKPNLGMSLENKLNGQSYDYTNKQVGLTNLYGGVGTCRTGGMFGSIAPCSSLDATTGYGRYYYYIAH